MYFTEDYKQLDVVALYLLYNADITHLKPDTGFQKWLTQSLLAGTIKRL